MMDKSTKTKYEDEKERLVSEIEHHLNSHKDMLKNHDPVFVHIVANNFVDALLQIAYHYESEEWAMELLNKYRRCICRESVFEPVPFFIEQY